jgi:hypothetical protein
MRFFEGLDRGRREPCQSNKGLKLGLLTCSLQSPDFNCGGLSLINDESGLFALSRRRPTVLSKELAKE